jgi:hypothetical protein
VHTGKVHVQVSEVDQQTENDREQHGVNQRVNESVVELNEATRRVENKNNNCRYKKRLHSPLPIKAQRLSRAMNPITIPQTVAVFT